MSKPVYRTEENGQIQLDLPDYNRTYKKANLFISAKYKSTLLEEKLWALSLSRLQNEYSNDVEINVSGEIVVHMRAADIRKLLGIKGGSFYSQLNTAANSMTNKTIGFVDPERERFAYMAVITYAEYKDGIFSVTYNSKLKDFVLNLRSQYALFSLQTSLKFKNVYAYRLYQILRAKCYPRKGDPVDKADYSVYFSLAELKLELGIVNSELTPVKVILSEKDHPNYDKALAACPESERMFDEWSELRRCVLVPACREIGEKTEINVSFEPRKSGRGAKVSGLDFFVTYTDKAKSLQYLTEIPPVQEEDKSDFIIQVIDLIDEKIKSSDAQAIAEAAGYNIDVVEKAYGIAKKQKNIDNLVGFMISAIKNDWSVAVEKKGNGKSKREMRGNYDIDEIERLLVSNHK